MNGSVMVPALAALSGLCWTIVYVDCLRLGIKQRTYAMPFWAVGLNLAWEGVHTVVGYREEGPSLQVIINVVWLALDVGILYTLLRYGRKHHPTTPGWSFFGWIGLGLVTAVVLQLLFVAEFGLVPGGAYAAFSQNLIMSILFIDMLQRRGGSEGQSLTIAVAKWLGTLAPTVVFGVIGGPGFGPSRLVLGLGVFCSVFDLIYVVMLSRIRADQRQPRLRTTHFPAVHLAHRHGDDRTRPFVAPCRSLGIPTAAQPSAGAESREPGQLPSVR